MTASAPLKATPSLASAIDQAVLQVLPDTSAAKVVHQMSAADAQGDRNSCALVVDTLAPDAVRRVVGIVTERDIVKLVAAAPTEERSLDLLPVSAIMTAPVKTLETSAFQDIFAVLFLFRRYRIRHLPVVDAQDSLIGVVTPASIRKVLRPANLLKMRRVADVMSQDVIRASPQASVKHLAQKMADSQVSCVVIVDSIEGGLSDEEPNCDLPVGIVTERDIVQFQALQIDLESTRAEAVMSSPLFLLDPKDSLWTAHEMMKQHRVRRLVVSWNWGQGLGIVTQTNLLRVFDPIEMYGIIDSLQTTVDQLAHESAEELSSGLTSSNLGPGQLMQQAIAFVEQATRSHQFTDAGQQRLKQAVQLIEQAGAELP